MNGLNYLLNRCYETDRPVKRKYKLHVAERASLAKPPPRKK